MKKDKAIKYLRKNILLNIGMIEPIRRCTAEILYAEIDGVLIREMEYLYERKKVMLI